MLAVRKCSAAISLNLTEASDLLQCSTDSCFYSCCHSFWHSILLPWSCTSGIVGWIETSHCSSYSVLYLPFLSEIILSISASMPDLPISIEYSVLSI